MSEFRQRMSRIICSGEGKRCLDGDIVIAIRVGFGGAFLLNAAAASVGNVTIRFSCVSNFWSDLVEPFQTNVVVESPMPSTTAAPIPGPLVRGPSVTVVLGAIMVPMTALAIPTYLLFAGAGLTNTVWAIILPSLVSPFGVYLMRIYAEESIPDTLLEAARIDGAGEFRIFWQIALRIMVPGLVTVLLFALVATWNNYFLPLIMLSDPTLFPLTLGLAQLQAASEAGGGASAQFSTVITGSLVSIVPLVIVFLYLQKYWQSGLTTGGVKE